ncbi:MAG: hypothetical protein AAFQ64_13295 [Pseudomonadota bacterium]
MDRVISHAAGLFALAALVACADITSFGTPSTETTTLRLLGGQAVAAAPQDFCIAQSVSRPADGFVVMARCESAEGPSAEGVITLQVGEAGTGLAASDATALRELLRSETGRALLSQSGDADAISVETTEVAEDAVTVRFRDREPAPIAGLQSTEWRGFLDVNGRLATIAVRGLAAAPLGTDDGEILLAQSIAAVRRANEPGVTLVGG